MSVWCIAVRCNNTGHPKKGMSMLKILFSSVWVRAIFEWPWKMVSVSVRYCFISQWMKRSKHRLFVFPPKKTRLIWRRHCSIGQSCCSMTSKRSIDWFLESSSGIEFFQPSVRLSIQSHARLYPFNKPIKLLYFRSFFVSVLFARCHFKVIRKSLKTLIMTSLMILSISWSVEQVCQWNFEVNFFKKSRFVPNAN